jgi:hypothetical protein
LDPGSGMGKKSESGSGIRIRDEQPGYQISKRLETSFWVKIIEFFYADPDPGSGIFLTLDPKQNILNPFIDLNKKSMSMLYMSCKREVCCLRITIFWFFSKTEVKNLRIN